MLNFLPWTPNNTRVSVYIVKVHSHVIIYLSRLVIIYTGAFVHYDGKNWTNTYQKSSTAGSLIHSTNQRTILPTCHAFESVLITTTTLGTSDSPYNSHQKMALIKSHPTNDVMWMTDPTPVRDLLWINSLAWHSLIKDYSSSFLR